MNRQKEKTQYKWTDTQTDKIKYEWADRKINKKAKKYKDKNKKIWTHIETEKIECLDRLTDRWTAFQMHRQTKNNKQTNSIWIQRQTEDWRTDLQTTHKPVGRMTENI
jgi:hypothetical protein